jgi:thiamine transporter ThiT
MKTLVFHRSPLLKLTFSAMFLAIGLVLPYLTGNIPEVGSALCPMHIPVLLCGLICGWKYGLMVGLVLPVLRSLLFGMPPLFPTAAAMAFELATYGAVSGMMLKFVHTGKTYPDLYIAMVTAMLAGRIVSGIAKALIFSPGLALSAWVTASFVTALPGILVQLVLLPTVVFTLMKAKLIPYRYPKEIKSE